MPPDLSPSDVNILLAALRNDQTPAPYWLVTSGLIVGVPAGGFALTDKGVAALQAAIRRERAETALWRRKLDAEKFRDAGALNDHWKSTGEAFVREAQHLRAVVLPPGDWEIYHHFAGVVSGTAGDVYSAMEAANAKFEEMLRQLHLDTDWWSSELPTRAGDCAGPDA